MRMPIIIGLLGVFMIKCGALGIFMMLLLFLDKCTSSHMNGNKILTSSKEYILEFWAISFSISSSQNIRMFKIRYMYASIQ